MMSKVLFALLCSSLVAHSVASAQEDGRKWGVVGGAVLNAETREPLPSANVTLEGTSLGASTASDGRFSIVGVPVGTYVVRVSLLGYIPRALTDIVVTPTKPVELILLVEESKIEFGEVSVKADFFQRSPDASVSTQAQSFEEIRQLPGGLEDVVRAISILPGVAQVEAGRNDLIVRGGAPSENLFLVDNIEIPNINHFGTQGASGGPLSFINLDFVEGTTFSTGGFGVKYGDKLSSVLAIDLRNGRTDKMGGKVTISASQFGLNLEGPLGQRGTFFLSARRSYLDMIFKAAGFSFVPEYWDFLAKGDYRLDNNNRLSVLGIGAVDRVRFFNDSPDKRFDNSRILGSDQDQLVGGVTWQHLFSSGFSTATFAHRYVTYSYGQSDPSLRTIFSSVSRESESSLSSDLTLQLSKHAELSAGVQGKVAAVRTALVLSSYVTSYGQAISLNTNLDTTAFKGGAHAQYNQQVGKLKIIFGSRLDYFSLIDTKFAFSPRVSASYAIDARTNVSLSIGRYYQSPSYVWLLANPENRKLTYIRADQYLVGIEHLLRDDAKISFEVYLKKYLHYPASVNRPYLVMANTGAGFGGADEGFASFGFDSLVSLGEGQAYGLELFTQKKFSGIPCYGTLSISFCKSRYTSLDGVSRYSSFDQRWIVNLGGGYVFNERWEASAKFRLATGRPYTPFNADGTQNAALYNSERVAVNHGLDVRVDRRWLFDSWTLIAFIDIQNIYNRKPVDVPRYDARKKVTESPATLGILPSLGLSAEF